MIGPIEIGVKSSVESLMSRVHALSDHVANASDGDPVAILARSIGEIDADQNVIFAVNFCDGDVQVTATACGNLARLLDLFEDTAQ